MATQTTNLGLTLPIGTEQVSRQVINDNMTAIDNAVGAVPSGQNLQLQVTNNANEITGLKSAITSTAKEKAEYHLGFYRDAQGCLCEIDQ